MKYLTIDFEYADRILPSICEITIIEKDGVKSNVVYHTKLNPDCEVEEFFYERHSIRNELVDSAPYIYDVWGDIYNILKDKVVFCHEASKNMPALHRLLSINYLNMPDFQYFCSASLFKRVWGSNCVKNIKLDTIVDFLNFPRQTKFHSSYDDAYQIGNIVSSTQFIYGTDNIYTLFSEIGFAGGFFVGNNRFTYRANKIGDSYLAKIKEPETGEAIYMSYENQKNSSMLA